jgi:Tfp pilus assembly protein PilZ
MSHERREDPRRPVSVEAWWEGLSGRHQARASDLSMGGCFIDTLGRADVGEFMLLALKLPTGEWLRLRGQVASVAPKNTGFSVAFTYLTEDEQQALAQLLDA